MSSLLVAAALSIAPPGPLDVSTLKVGPPSTVVELDLGKLKGELRRVSWAPDGSKLYIRTTEGDDPTARQHHYSVATSGGEITSLPMEPDWAAQYWSVKSDRSAPGNGAVMIDVEQKLENVKYGTGSAGAADSGVDGDRTGGNTVMSGANIDRAAVQQKQHVVRLTLFGEAVSEFVNERPVPGLMFSWGPTESAAIAYTTREGRLVLLDQQRHKQTVSEARDALLPAWSLDGTRIAWVQKTGRRKYRLMSAPVSLDR